MRARDGGFTLIELMMAVVVLGILVTIAVVAYTKNIKKTHAGEVPQILGELKAREEVFHTERGFYVPLCPNPLDDGTYEDCAEGDYWPPTLPGNGVAMEIPTLPARWQQVKVGIQKAELYCQYEVIAGKATHNTNIGAVGLVMFPTTPVRNWYYLMARCNWDSNAAVNEAYWQRDDWQELGKENDGR